MDDELMLVAGRLSTARRVVALTGAGISEESGIPTFRDPQTGLWARYDPLTLATAEAFARDPKLVWDWYEWRRGLRRQAKPNPGHYALAKMASRLAHFVLITQNIDGLHATAGSADVLELHGNIFRDKCSREGTLVERAKARSTQTGIPACPNCGAYLRPDVVWFGEALPREVLDCAFQESMRSDVFLSIGTSAVVEPAASLPRIAKSAGAFLVEVNPAETALSTMADAVLRGKAGELLPKLAENLRSQISGP
jgi:NAD-dependent deacetylase